MPEAWGDGLTALALLLAANGAPVLVRWWLGERAAWPVDAGWYFFDGRPLLGAAKTWRGIAAALFATTLLGGLLGLGWELGAAVGALAMSGDLLASFLKRRLGVVSSGRVPGLDQIPEALLPTAVLYEALGLDGWGVLLVVAAFSAVDILLSPLLYRLHLRRRPY